MNTETIGKVKTELTRLTDRIKELEAAQDCDKPGNYCWTHPKETGSVRRASMDLTRALAEMRKPG